MRIGHLRNDLIEIHCGGIDDACAGRRVGEDLYRNERTGVETDRGVMDVIPPTERQQIGCSGAGTDEVNCHGSTATAQVQKRPVRRGTSRRAVGPSEAKADASATLEVLVLSRATDE